MIDKALQILRPGAQWTLVGEKYEDIIWHDETVPPTPEEIANQVEEIEKTNKCYLQRLAAYPPLAEQLDMMFHDFEMWKTTIQDIKKRYPKP